MLDTLFKRKSIRKYTNQKIEDKDVRIILKAGMSGPTCANRRQWSFIVVRDKKTLNQMVEVTSPYARILKGADMGILVCADMERASINSPEYWVIDASIACQNMILAAKRLGIGTCWLGIWPKKERIDGLSKLFELTETAIPFSIISFGYPDEEFDKNPELEIEEDRIHYEKW